MSDQAQQNQLTLFVEASPVRMSPLPDGGKALLESGRDYGSSLSGLLERLARAGLLSKMSPVFYPAIAEQTLPPSFKGWQTAGMAWAGGFLTLSISESPNAAAVCSLSAVLETDVPPKYYLSKKACAGILRRAEKGKKSLPTHLQQVLQNAVREMVE